MNNKYLIASGYVGLAYGSLVVLRDVPATLKYAAAAVKAAGLEPLLVASHAALAKAVAGLDVAPNSEMPPGA